MNAISPKEKDSICTILDEIEADITPSSPIVPLSKLEEIDKNCKSIWPSWNGPFYIPSNYPEFFDQESKTSNPEDYLKGIPTESNQSERSRSLCESNTPNEHSIKQINTTNSPEAQQLADEVDEIKDDITEIMKKLSKTVSFADEVPPLVEADPFIACDMDENDRSTVENVKKYYSKEVERKKIIAVQKKILEMRKKNKKLEDELLSIKQKYVDSQKRIARLRKEVRRSNIVLEDMKKKEEKKQAELEHQTNAAIGMTLQ